MLTDMNAWTTPSLGAWRCSSSGRAAGMSIVFESTEPPMRPATSQGGSEEGERVLWVTASRMPFGAPTLAMTRMH
jgi:hypothetical protein